MSAQFYNTTSKHLTNTQNLRVISLAYPTWSKTKKNNDKKKLKQKFENT